MENVGPRSATLRPHIPRRGDCTGLLRKKGLDANHDYVIAIKWKIEKASTTEVANTDRLCTCQV